MLLTKSTYRTCRLHPFKMSGTHALKPFLLWHGQCDIPMTSQHGAKRLNLLWATMQHWQPSAQRLQGGQQCQILERPHEGGIVWEAEDAPIIGTRGVQIGHAGNFTAQYCMCIVYVRSWNIGSGWVGYDRENILVGYFYKKYTTRIGCLT